MRKYRPLGKRVIVEILPLEQKQVKSEGGLITADSEHEGLAGSLKRLRAKVIAFGTLVEDVDLKKVGTIVLLEEYAGILVDKFVDDVVWVEEDQIVAIEQEG